MHGDASLARLYREFGDRWEIEPIPPGTKWIAVLRESEGDYIRIVAAHQIGTLRFRMTNVERDVPEERAANIATGQAYVTNLINTIMKGPDWDSTAIFLTWDDWGGFYDNVVPPKVNANGYGLRVPGLVISPYAKRGYIDHQILSFDAFNKFIEDDFLDGQRLDPATDGRPDIRPTVRENMPILGNLINDFDFSQPPRPPVLLPLHPKSGPASRP